ncbi:prolyl endopeptidase-like protein [Blastocladiella britannica]|nr:prolyl endopeptidase-like protein [Blastocladiella britannica]
MSPTKPAYPWGKYPAVRRSDFSETLHGRAVADPYRWLEEPDSAETKQFVESQAKLTEDYLAQYPDKAKFEAALTKNMDYARYSAPAKHGAFYYYWYNSGLQNQSVLYRTADLDAPVEKAEVFFNPNTLSDDGTVALSSSSFSEDDTYFGYSLSKSGSDWVTIHVKKVADGIDLPDVIHHGKFTSINWTQDEGGFFYNRYPKVESEDLGTETDANLNAQCYYHKLGTPQSEDILVYKDDANPTYSGRIGESDCGKFLILSVHNSTAPKNLLWIAPHSGPASFSSLPWIKVVDDVEIGGFNYITNDGTTFWFQSNWKAPRERILKYDVASPHGGAHGLAAFEEVIPEDPKGGTLNMAEVVDGNHVMTVYMRDVKDALYLFSLTTGELLETINLPTVASVSGLSGKKKSAEVFYSFTSFLSPGTVLRYDLKTRAATTWRQITVPGFNPDDYEAKQEWFVSKFGTRVPMFIVHKKGIKLDGSHPAYLYGYGGFSIPLGPMFSPSWITFMAHYGAVLALANIRGGGEFGEDWHEDGMLHKKQNVFDDFQWASKHLVARGYTQHKKVAINGGSNGGLLVGACINQAPELFGAAVGEVGVMDMLRFHKFTIGHAWCADYGNPDTPADFEYNLKYSPVHNVTKQVYPATLLMTSDHDDRVVPLHSYKLAAELQHANPENPHPLLIQIEQKAGHGAGKPTKKRIESAAQKFAFIAMNVGAEWRD